MSKMLMPRQVHEQDAHATLEVPAAPHCRAEPAPLAKD